MLISEIFDEKHVILNIHSEKRDDVFKEMLKTLCKIEKSCRYEEFLYAIIDRENKRTSGIVEHVAIPHAKTGDIDQVTGMIGISKKGIDFDSLDGEPVHLIFLLITDINDPSTHLKILKNLATLLMSKDFYETIISAVTPEHVIATIKEAELTLQL